MKRGLTGRYQITRTGEEEVRAFIPHPAASRASRRSRQRAPAPAGARHPGAGAARQHHAAPAGPQLFLYAYVRREAVLSSQIEGTQSSLSDLLLFELERRPGVPLDDVVEVSNYVAALEHGVARLRGGFPLSNRLLREMHGEAALARPRQRQAPGEFRRSQNWIGGTRPGNAQFVPPPPPRCGGLHG